jgi:hypothetical protein
MRCSSCGFENAEGMKCCTECATPLKPRCPQRGFENPSRAKFCGECATPLPGQTPVSHPSSAPQPPLRYTPGHLAEKTLTSRSALEGERKPVTVLFADLKGSLELVADGDPVLERMMSAVRLFAFQPLFLERLGSTCGTRLSHEHNCVRASLV